MDRLALIESIPIEPARKCLTQRFQMSCRRVDRPLEGEYSITSAGSIIRCTRTDKAIDVRRDIAAYLIYLMFVM